MKKFLWVLALGLLLDNVVFAKTLNITKDMVLEVPKSYEFIKIDQTNSSDILYGFGEIFKEYEIELEFFVVAPRIVLETVQLIINGKRLEDIKILKPIFRKLEKKNFSNYQNQMKWLVKEIKKLMKKEKVDFVTYVILSKQKLNEIDNEEFKNFINIHQSMNNSELTEISKEYRKAMTELAGDNKTILVNEDMSLIIKKFNIAKDNNGILFLESNMIMNFMNVAKVPFNIFISKKNEQIYFIASECWVNCSKQNIKFEKMIKIMFSTISSTTSSISNENDVVNQLQQLNELYETGVLTKEEFEKAKKKLLN